MGQTTKYHIYYPDDYSEVADVPKEMKLQAESTDTALDDIDISAITGNLADLTTTDKTNLVSAINEVNGLIGDIGTALDQINGEVV